MQRADVILSLLSHKAQNRPHFVFTRLYRYLFHIGLYQWVTNHQSDNMLREMIDKLRDERYKVGENQQQDHILAQVLYQILFCIYQSELVTNPWKPIPRLADALRSIQQLDAVASAVQTHVVFSSTMLTQVLNRRIQDGRLIRLLAQFLSHSQQYPHLAHLLEEIFLLCIRDDWSKENRQAITPISHQQQAVFFLKRANIAEKLMEMVSAYIGDVVVDHFNFHSKHRMRLPFHGFEITYDGTMHRLLLLIPLREVRDRLRPFMANGKAIAVTNRMHRSVDEIIQCYQQEEEKVKQIYQQAHNGRRKLQLYHYFHQQSLIYTLAQKLKRSPKQIMNKYRLPLKSMT